MARIFISNEHYRRVIMIRYRFLKIISLKTKLGNRRLDMIVNLPV